MLGFASTRRHWFLRIVCASVGVFWVTPGLAQITPDSTLPNNSNVRVQGNINLIEAGTTAGNNLFHSFREFSVSTGTEAHFNNGVDIRNIITRVTGKSVSNIDGLIKANGGANLFLINPSGIVFGKNARLDIGGSFVGSTADAIGFGKDNFFSASNPESSSSLLQINPNALFFNQIKTASIENNSIVDVGLNPSDNNPGRGLRVPDGKTLQLVGGNVNMDGGGLVARGGRVELGGLATTGTVGLNVDGDNLSLTFPSEVERSDVTLSNSAGIRVTADNSGSIGVNAQNLEMTAESFLFAGIESGLGSEQSKAGNIDINATGTISVKGDSEIANQVLPQARGQGGDVNINTNTLLLEGGVVTNTTFGEGNGGNLKVNAENVQVIGTDVLLGSILSVVSRSSSTGDTGDLTIQTNALLVRDGGIVSANSFSTGKAGRLSIDAKDVQVIGTDKDGFPSGLFASEFSNPTNDVGSLNITTNTLLVRDKAQVGAGTFGASKGADLTINAKDIQVIGTGENGQSFSSFLAVPEQNSTQDTGDSTQNNILLLIDGTPVDANTFGAARGGRFIDNAQDLQLLARFRELAFPSSLFVSAQANSTGNVGTLKVKTNTLSIRDGAEVFTGTFGAGEGGDLNIDAQDVRLIGTSQDGRLGGLSTTAQRNLSGNAGNLRIKTSILQVEDGAKVSVEGFSQEGSAGSLTINADSIRLNNNASLTADTRSNEVDPSSEQATININSRDLIMRRGSKIETNAEGKNVVGGDININTDIIAALENSDISANSANFRGGNVLIETQGIFGTQFRPEPTNISDITATGASEDLSGNVEIINPDIDPSSGLVNLPTIPVQTEVAQGCTAGSSIAKSKFEIIGRGGLPSNPTQVLRPDAVQVDLLTLKPEVNKTPAKKVNLKPNTSKSKKIVEATGWIQNKKGEIFLVADAPNVRQIDKWYQKIDCPG